MKHRKLLYLILLAGLVMFFILYNGVLSFQLLLFAVVFPAVLWIALWILRASLRVSLVQSTEPAAVGGEFHWILTVQNRSIIPAADACAVLEYYSAMTGVTETVKVDFSVLPRNTERVQLAFSSAVCGMVVLRLRSLTVYDPLLLFHRTLRRRISDSRVVLPARRPLPEDALRLEAVPVLDSDIYDNARAGDDPSEVYGLHAYREGDPVSRIHWKLSSKQDQLFVKEGSLPIAGELLLLPDFRMTDDGCDRSALALDAVLSACDAVARELLEDGIPFSMLRFSPAEGIIKTEQIRTNAEIEDFFRVLLSAQPDSAAEQGALLAVLEEQLFAPVMPDRLMLFVPRLSEALTSLAAAVPDPARMMLCTVRNRKEAADAPSAAYFTVASTDAVPPLLREVHKSK